jgi:peptidoglycan/LPS O-acetylase OafA/YrhL
VIPFFLLLNIRLAVLLVSVVVFALASLGVIDGSLGFVTLPGSLWIFLCGSLLATWKRDDKVAISIVTLLAAAGLFLTFLYPSLDHGFTRSALLGTLTGILCVYFLRTAKAGSFDQLAGNIAYGVFLSHFVFIWLGHLWGTTASFGAATAVMAGSTFSAAITFYLVERPALNWRRRFRRRPQSDGAGRAEAGVSGMPASQTD